MEEKVHAIKSFKAKKRVIISDEPTFFNGIIISKGNNNMVPLTQDDMIKKVEIPSWKKSFASKRAMCKYMGVNRIPYTRSSVQLIASRKEATSREEFKILEKFIRDMN